MATQTATIGATIGATAILRSVMHKLNTWAIARRDAAMLMARTPDQREDLGLTLRDMTRMGA